MIFRRLQRKLREVRHHSRRVERNVFDRAQSIGFVIAAFAAPVAAYTMNEWHRRDRAETVLIVRVYVTVDSDVMRATVVDERGSKTSAPLMIALADVRLMSESEWRGWPLVTSHSVLPTRMDTQLLGAARESQRTAIIALAQRECERSGLTRTTSTHENHIASWVFVFGTWWLLISFTFACALMPLRFANMVYRRARTSVRQGRVNRLHCPNCGYDARESVFRGVCPECGSELYERPDY